MKIGRDLAANLAAYIPVTLTQRILTRGLPDPGESHALMAATLFSDISGFTAMSEELASDGPRGAEELNRVLLLTFTGLINVIHEMGGAVNHFHGDAMSVYFPDEDGQAARRALTCAQKMQRLMLTHLRRVVAKRPANKKPFFDLTIKIGVGYGRCREIFIGDPIVNMEYALAGTAVDEAAAAEKKARAGQIMASQSVLVQAGLPAPDAFNLLTENVLPDWQDWTLPHPILNWGVGDESALARLVTAVTPFIPPIIYERTTAGLSDMAEHRPVTSVFVQFKFHDRVGDSEETWLQHYFLWARQIVARFGSQNARLNRVLTGDKGNQLHIMFGAPMAPDAPDQAIRCALALQRERPAFVASQRIGLTAGKVFASPVGAVQRREYTVVGDVVNLSARLTQICQDGQVLTDKTTADRAREWIDFIELPPVQLKGKQAPVTLYQPRGDRGAGDQGKQAHLQVFINHWQRPLVGREPDLDLLLGGMDVALQGAGGVAAVFGPTGVGKTSLLAVGVKYWLDSGGTALAGECQQHTSDIPFSPWRTVWRDFLGLTAAMDVATQVTAVTARTFALVPDCGDDVGLWADVLGLPIPQADRLSELTAEVRQARFFNLVNRAFQAAAAQRALLIILEGLHWADQSSLALIDHLSTHQAEHALFMALTFRPLGKLSLETLSRPICTPIILSDLPPRRGRELLRQLVGTADLPPAVEQHLGLRGRDGSESPVNPLFLEEAVNMMVGLGVLQINGRLQVNESLLSQMQIPDTIHGLLLARIDRLPVASRDLLQVASVIGRQFNLAPLVSIAPDMPREVAASLLADLTAEEITQLMTADPEWSYLFQHAMTHEVAYESLPFARRQKLHAAIADWLMTQYQDNLKPFYAVLAYHYSRADNHEQGLRFALAAADSARDIFANQEALELYTLAEEHLLAVGVAANWETAVNLYASRGYVLRFLGDFTNATKDIEKGLALSLDNNHIPHAAHTYNLLADILYRQSHFEKALKTASQVITQLGPAVPPKERALAYLWLGMNNSALGNFPEALGQLRNAEELCLAAGDNQQLARVLEAIAFVHYQQKELPAALQAMQRSVELSRNFSTPMNLASSLNNIALVQHQLGQAAEALTTLNESIELARETSRNFLARFIGSRVEVLTYIGRFSEAQADFEQAITLFMMMDDELALAELYLVMGYEHYSLREQWDEAQNCFQQAAQIINSRPDDYAELHARLLIVTGQVKLHTGSITQAQQDFAAAANIIEEKNLAWWQPIVYYFKGVTNSRLDNQVSAQKAFLHGIEAINNEGCPDYLPLLLLELAQLEKNPAQKLNHLKNCLQAADSRARSLDKIKCFSLAGKFLAAAKEPAMQTLGKDFLARSESIKLY